MAFHFCRQILSFVPQLCIFVDEIIFSHAFLYESCLSCSVMFLYEWSDEQILEALGKEISPSLQHSMYSNIQFFILIILWLE